MKINKVMIHLEGDDDPVFDEEEDDDVSTEFYSIPSVTGAKFS